MRSGLLIIVIILSGCKYYGRPNKLENIDTLPTFRILSIDSSSLINTINLPPGDPRIFIYFDPDCEFCQKETKDIIIHIADLQKAKVFFLTNQPFDRLRDFTKYFQLTKFNNIYVGKDFQYSFYKQFLPSEIPYIAIYDRNNRLKKIYEGTVNITSIINAIEN